MGCSDRYFTPPPEHLITFKYFFSLGAGISFEVARHLKLHYDIQPVHMLISSSSAPQVSADRNAQLSLDLAGWSLNLTSIGAFAHICPFSGC